MIIVKSDPESSLHGLLGVCLLASIPHRRSGHVAIPSGAMSKQKNGEILARLEVPSLQNRHSKEECFAPVEERMKRET